MKSFPAIVLILCSLIVITATAITADDTPQIDPSLELIHALGCKGCHMISGEGGSLAVDLRNVGNRMSAKQIKAHLIADPATRTTGFMPSYRSLPEKDLERISEYLYTLP